MSQAEHLERGIEYRQQGDLRASVIELKNILQENPNNVEGRWQLGLTYLALDDGAQAESELLHARELGQEPGPRSSVALARARVLQGQFDSALALLDEAKASDEASINLESYLVRGLALIGKEQPQAARRWFEQALEIEPDSVEALLGIAWSEQLSDDLEQANKWVDRALELAPNNAKALRTRGDIARDREQLAIAEEAYGKAIKASFKPYELHMRRAMVRLNRNNPAGAETDLAAMRRIAAEHPITHYLSGLLHLRNERYSEAQSDFEAVLNRLPEHQASTYLLGAAHFAQGHLNQAENHLRRYLQENPQSARASALLARVHMQQARGDDAIQVLEQGLAAAASPQPILGELLGGLYLSRGQEARGLETLQVALNNEPDSASLQEMLGMALMRSGERNAGLQALRKASELDSKPRRADAALILAHLETRDYEAALEAAVRYRDKQTDNAEAHNFVGAALTGLERPEEAGKAFEKALELDPDYYPAAMNLGNLQHRQGHNAKAREIFENIQQREPGHVGSARKLATLEMQDGRIEAAQQWLDSALQANPKSLELAIMLARVQMRAGDEAQALQTLSRALERHPEQLDAYYAHANVLLALERPGDAIRVLSKAEQVEPESAEVQRRLASAHEQAGNRETMVKHLRKAVALDAEHVPGRIQLTMALARSGELDAARRQLRNLQNEHAGRPEVQALNGWFALRDGELAKGINYYKRALAQRQHRPWLMELVRARQNANDQAGAVSDLRRWLETAPRDTRARHMLAIRQMALGEDEAAMDSYEQLLEQEADNAPALNNLAWLLRERDPGRALSLVARARELAPDSAVLLDTQGVVLFYNQKLGESARILAQAAEQSPDDPAVHYHLGRTLHALGDRKAAREHLQRAIAGNTPFAEREAAESLYQKLAD